MQLTKLLEGRSVLHIFFRMKYKNLCCKSWCCSWSHNLKNYSPRASSLEAPGLHDTNLNTLSPQKSNPGPRAIMVGIVYQPDYIKACITHCIFSRIRKCYVPTVVVIRSKHCPFFKEGSKSIFEVLDMYIYCVHQFFALFQMHIVPDLHFKVYRIIGE